MKPNMNKLRKSSRRFKQLGAAMLETLGSVALGAVVLGGIADQTNRYMDSTKASVAGDQHRLLSEAAKKYIEMNQNTFNTGITKLDLNAVINGSPFAANLSSTNIYKEQLCLLAKKNSAGAMEGVLIAAKNSAMAEANKEWRTSMMINAGNVSMGRMTSANTAARGNIWNKDLAGWNVAGNCGGDQTGSVVTNLEILQIDNRDELLHRKDVGNQSLNTMETDLYMSGKNINNAGNVVATSVTANTLILSGTSPSVQSKSDMTLDATKDVIIKTAGAERMRVTQNGDIAINTSSNLFFGNQVRQMINLWGTKYGIGVQNGTTYLRTDADFQFYKGGTHNDAQGNAGGGTALMTIKSNGNVGIGKSSPSEKLDVEGNINANGNINATGTNSGGYLQAKTGVTVGASCSPPGLVAVASNIPVFCSPNTNQWEHYVGFEIIRRGTTSRPPGDDTVAYSECGQGETLIGGGGECGDPTRHYLHFSRAQGNLWGVNCFGRDNTTVDSEATDKRAFAYSICLRPKNSMTVKTDKTHEDANPNTIP